MATIDEFLSSKGIAPKEEKEEVAMEREPLTQAPSSVFSQVAAYKPAQSIPTKSFEDVLANPEDMKRVRDYVTLRDTNKASLSDKEALEEFSSYMRWFSSNTASVGSTAYSIATGTDEDRIKYGEGFKLWDEMATGSAEDDYWSTTKDYASAVLADPTTYLTFGGGKLIEKAFTGAAGKAAAKKTIDMAVAAAAKRGVKEPAQKALRDQMMASVVRGTTLKTVAATTAFEAGVSVIENVAYQKARIDTGAQEQFSFVDLSAQVALGAALGAGLGWGKTKLGIEGKFNDTGMKVDRAAAQRAQVAAKKASRRLKEVLAKKQVEWTKMVHEGLAFGANTPLQQSIGRWFLDVNDKDSFLRIITAAGARIETRAGGQAFTKSLMEFAAGMSDTEREVYDKMLKPLGTNFSDAMNVMASMMSTAGQDLNMASKAVKYVHEVQNIGVGRKRLDRHLEAIEKQLAEEAAGKGVEVPRDLPRYFLSSWKGLLTSTPFTTAANVRGWQMAYAANKVSDVVRMTTLYGVGAVESLAKGKLSQKVLRANAIGKNIGFSLQTMLDPHLSAETFFDLMSRSSPSSLKKVSKELFGGVERGTAEAYGVDPTALGFRWFEAYKGRAATFSLVKHQDAWTKGISGLTELDLQSREAFGRSLKDLIDSGETHLLTEDMWEKSIKQSLQDTFSEDLSGPHGLGLLAKVVQDLSAHPVGGYVIPFGGFMNNLLAFTWRYSPLSIVMPMARAITGKVDDDLGKVASRSAVGAMALGYMVVSQGKLQEQGYQWFERPDGMGGVEDITNLSPENLYALAGRIGHNYAQGEGMSISLLDTMKQLIGPLDAIDTVANPSLLKDIFKYLAADQSSIEDKSDILTVAAYAAESLTGIAAGFTRPFEPFSRVVGSKEVGGEGAIPNRKEGGSVDRMVAGLTRYTTGLINALLGEEQDGVRLVGTPRYSATEEGPVKQSSWLNAMLGRKTGGKHTAIDTLLGMVDKPPYLAESFTSGIPEYDSFVNEELFPMLEQRAKSLLRNEAFKKLPKSRQIKMVDDLLKQTKNDINTMLEGYQIDGVDERVINERRKLLILDSSARNRAKESLGIRTPDHQLSIEQIDAIKRYIDLEEQRDDVMLERAK